MNRNKIACHCHNVTDGQIIDAVRDGADTIEKVREKTHAGAGCAHCRDFIVHMIEDMKRFPEDYAQ